MSECQNQESFHNSDEELNEERAINIAQNYQFRDPQFSYLEISKLPNFSIKLSNQRVYFGQIFNNQKHGKGVLIFGHHFYEGEFNNNRKHGFGFEKFPSKSEYTGYYVNGKPEGRGKYLWPNGEYYDGEWINGSKHGIGTWVGSKEDRYVGNWKNGKPDGEGIHEWINGDRYEGQFKESLKHGYGVENFSNGDCYKGYYKNGKPEGEGEYFWNNGSYFHGTFMNGLRFGFGEFKNSQYTYKGFYQNDRKHGYGEIRYSDGSVFKGTFINDQCEEQQMKKQEIEQNNTNNQTPPKKIEHTNKINRTLQMKGCSRIYSNSPMHRTVGIDQIVPKSVDKCKLPHMRPPSSNSNSKKMNQTIRKIGQGQEQNNSGNRLKLMMPQQTIKLSNRPDFSVRMDANTTHFMSRTGLKGRQNGKQRSFSKVE